MERGAGDFRRQFRLPYRNELACWRLFSIEIETSFDSVFYTKYVYFDECSVYGLLDRMYFVILKVIVGNI